MHKDDGDHRGSVLVLAKALQEFRSHKRLTQRREGHSGALGGHVDKAGMVECPDKAGMIRGYGDSWGEAMVECENGDEGRECLIPLRAAQWS